MPTENYLPLCDRSHLVSFPFDVKDGTEMEMGGFLDDYTQNRERNMDFDSKEMYLASFDHLASLTVTIGTTLSAIIGLIGIANFVDSILTSMIARKKEGMTGRHLKGMLIYEGLFYARRKIFASALLGTLFSIVVVRGIANEIWFFRYEFVIWPLLVLYPFFILLTIAVPAVLYGQIARASIIERLRQN